MNLAFVAYAYYSLGELEPSREYSMRALDCARETGHLTAEAEAHEHGRGLHRRRRPRGG